MRVLFLLVFVLLPISDSKKREEPGEEEWSIQLKPGVNPQTFASEHGFHYVGPITIFPAEMNYHLFTAPRGRHQGRSLGAENPQVKWSQRQEPRMQYKRGIPDPLYSEQWHLHGHPFGVEMEYVPSNVTGHGITIAIVDDGLQHAHPDLHANFDAENSWDFNDNDSDPSPVGSRDGHGTAAAGVAGAVRENGHCGRGAAPGASLMGVRAIAGPVTDLTEAQALSHNAMAVADIFSCSWGPADTGTGMDAPGDLTEQVLALYAANLRGRLGKGTIYVWASGNGRDNQDTCAFDGYAGSPYVIAIGALDHTGNQSWYSEGCASLMAVAPSSGAMRGITTVDLMGNAGYDPGECTSTFGGTSSAAPLAAGIIALILQERPDLTWRDVKHVIAKGAHPVNTGDGSWHLNKAGFRHSDRYGFGLLKVPGLLLAARSHQNVPAMFVSYRSGLIQLNRNEGVIPWNKVHTIQTSNVRFIEHVTLRVHILHPRRGNICLSLVSPAGTVSVLANERPKDDHMDYPYDGWRFTSVKFWGETQVEGNWIVVTEDYSQSTVGTGRLVAYELGIFGY
jgi:proprotein convertase subtilisin/kexin type 7